MPIAWRRFHRLRSMGWLAAMAAVVQICAPVATAQVGAAEPAVVAPVADAGPAPEAPDGELVAQGRPDKPTARSTAVPLARLPLAFRPALMPTPVQETPIVSGPMDVTLVRSNEPGCEPRCAEWIAAQGRIDRSSLFRLKRVLSRLGNRNLPIFLESPGGNVDEALKIARLIRQHRATVVLARTTLETCRTGDRACLDLRSQGIRRGAPASMAYCASSCVLVLAGGQNRLIGEMAVVGVHQAARFTTRYRVFPGSSGWGGNATPPRVVKESVTQAPARRSDYLEMAELFREMGVSLAIMKPMVETPHDKLRVLTWREIDGFKLATDRLTGRQLLAIVEPKRSAPRRPVPASCPLADRVLGDCQGLPEALPELDPATAATVVGFDDVGQPRGLALTVAVDDVAAARRPAGPAVAEATGSASATGATGTPGAAPLPPTRRMATKAERPATPSTRPATPPSIPPRAARASVRATADDSPGVPP